MGKSASQVAHALRTKLINTTAIAVLTIFSFGIIVPMLSTQSASAATTYSNGFEADTSGWSAATRVSSPLAPSSGAYYAQVPNGAYTQWGGYESAFPVGGYTTKVDVHLDMAEATGGADKRFDFSSAINTPSGSHQRDFVFNLGTNPSQANQWLASVGNNTPGNPSASVNNTVSLNETGWYTLTANFHDNGSGVLAVTMSISKVGGGFIGTWTLSNPSDVIGSTVGGHRYGWLVNQQAPANQIPVINVDNASLELNTALPACTSSSFDASTVGTVNGQEGWSSTGPYDQSVVDNVYGYSQFGCKSLRLSNAVTTGGFVDQTFSPSTVNEAGESGSTNGGQSGGTRQSHYEAQFDLASVLATLQPGMSISVSPDRGDGSRMSYLSFTDTPAGIDVVFYDVQGTGSPANFVATPLGIVDRTVPHTFKFDIDFVNGPSNDVVKIYVDSALKHTGTSWENYYRYDSESIAEQSPRTVDSLLFRAGGAAVPANSGKGYLIDNVAVTTSTPTPTPPVETPPATGGGSGSTTGSTGRGSAAANTPAATTTYIAYYDGNGNAITYEDTGVTTGDENTTEEGEVKGESTNKGNSARDDASKDAESENAVFLGLGWWWIPVIVAGIGIIYWVVVKRSDTTSSSS